MTDEKKTNEKKSSRKIKATTGAWWKSTVVEEDAESTGVAAAEPEQALPSEDASKAPAPKPRKRPSRPSAKRSSKTKAAEPVEIAEATAEPSAQQEAAPAPVVEAAAGEVTEKPKRSRRSGRKGPRRKRDEKEPEATASADDADTAEALVPQATDEAPVAADGPVDQESAGEDESPQKPKRRSRGRKKSSAKRAEKEVVAEDELPDDDLDDAFTDDDDFSDEDPGELPDEPEGRKEKVVLKLLINAEEPEECRLALLENGRLESIHVSTIIRAQTKNNIYKGKIVAIEPNLQAAFVDYGTEKNGFLPFSEIHPEYYRQELSGDIQKLVDAHQWKKLSITDVMEKGQEVLVQVVKEEVGKKGANMTTYLSLPGRSVVLMPGSDSSGISRKISGEERRNQLRKAMNSLDIPEGIGWIVRTASADITKTALARDVGYLLSLWEEIKTKAQGLPGVGQVYEDHQSVLRFLRENFDPDIEEIQVDDEDALEQVKQFISRLPSKQQNVKVRLHKGSRPIFNQYSIEDQIESIYQSKVNLPSGGSIVIDPTEALVAIDVNSGSTSKGKNFEQSIFQANMEAASELARQLRLRDLGGLIVVDFIDMRNKKHIREVERQVKQAMKRDKAKVDISRISKFGLMQISRQKLGAPIEAGNYRVCEHCKGRGTVRSVETLALFYLRRIQTGASRKHVQKVECRFPLDVAQYLLNQKRQELQEHESRYDTEITIIPDMTMSPVENEILLLKSEKDDDEKKQG